MSDAAFAAAVRLLREEPVQELLVRQALPLGVGQDRVELLGRERHLEGGEVGQDAFTQVGRGRCRHGVGRRLRARLLAAGHDRSLPPRGADSRCSGAGISLSNFSAAFSMGSPRKFL